MSVCENACLKIREVPIEKSAGVGSDRSENPVDVVYEEAVGETVRDS
jgi:hypothetical protein